jgi:hypothetical protein
LAVPKSVESGNLNKAVIRWVPVAAASRSIGKLMAAEIELLVEA